MSLGVGVLSEMELSVDIWVGAVWELRLEDKEEPYILEDTGNEEDKDIPDALEVYSTEALVDRVVSEVKVAEEVLVSEK